MKTTRPLIAIVMAVAGYIVTSVSAQTFTFTTVDAPNNVGLYTSQAIVNGNPAIAYYDATAQDLKYVRATNASGTAWGAPVTVVSTGDSGTFCSLTVVNGRPAISYHYSGGAGTDNLMYVRATDVDGTAWGVPVPCYTTGKVGEHTCLRVVNGRPAISFHDATDKALEYVRADDADGTAWSTLPVSLDAPGGSGAGHFNSMTIVNGNPAVSYYHQATKELRYVRATNVDGTAWGAPQTIDAAGGAGAGRYSSLAIVNGRPAISYHHDGGGDLHYIRALDADGAAWPALGQSLDSSTADNGHFTSLTIIDGLPAVSYYDNTGLDLRYIRAKDADGTLWNTPVIADTAGNVGQYTSLAKVTGGAGISYYDLTNGNLKFAFAATGPYPVPSSLGDVVTNNLAPNAAGASDGTRYEVLMRGGYIAENGTLAFPGTLKVGIGGTTLSNFSAYWKGDGVSSLFRFARMGEAAPETGASPAVFNILPMVPGLNDAGQVTLLAALLQTGSSTPPTTADNDTGLWSELGDTGFQILMREGDTVPGLSGVQVERFGSGCFATAKTGAGTGEAAFTILMRGASTDTALLRCSVVGSDTTAVGIVAREHASAPGTGETFGFLNSSYTDAVHMDALGNIVFGAILMPSYRTSIWYQPVTGGAPVKAMAAGDAAPGTTATFASLDLPSMGSAGTFAFRGVLNLDGDNVANDKNDGVWRGSVAGGFTNILRRGDSNTNRPGLFSPAYVALHPSVKAGNIYGGWLTNANRGAWLGWIDLGGDGINAYPTDSFGVYTDTSGTMTLIAASADTAPGIAGAQFYFIDHPVCGGQQQVAFIATVTGGGTTLGVNDKGIWRTAPNGGPLSVVIRTGDSMNTTQGVKVIADVDMPGSGDYGNHIWETPVMDATGKMIVVVTFTDGSTGEVLVP